MRTETNRANARKVRRIKRMIMRNIILTVLFAFTIGIAALTVHTFAIGFDLASISDSNANSETWRINPDGIKAANAVYENNAQVRDAIYNSDFWYTRFIAKANIFIQLSVFLGLSVLSVLLLRKWYYFFGIDIYIESIKEAHKKVKERNKSKFTKVHKNSRTA